MRVGLVLLVVAVELILLLTAFVITLGAPKWLIFISVGICLLILKKKAALRDDRH